MRWLSASPVFKFLSILRVFYLCNLQFFHDYERVPVAAQLMFDRFGACKVGHGRNVNSPFCVDAENGGLATFFVSLSRPFFAALSALCAMSERRTEGSRVRL